MSEDRCAERTLSLFAVLAFLVLCGSPAQAKCISPSFKFCDGCTVDASITTDNQSVCHFSYHSVGGIVSNRLRVRPHAGIYGISNITDAAYKPQPGYVGEDYFETEIVYWNLSHQATTTVRWHVRICDCASPPTGRVQAK
jgi:hypothetical protein